MNNSLREVKILRKITSNGFLPIDNFNSHKGKIATDKNLNNNR